jgi:hypothetical protein
MATCLLQSGNLASMLQELQSAVSVIEVSCLALEAHDANSSEAQALRVGVDLVHTANARLETALSALIAEG